MPSTYTTSLGLEKQATGENSGTWGTRLNDNTTALIEEAIAGVEVVAVSGSVTLTATTGATNQARNFGLKFTGTGGTVTAPAVEKVYSIFNACSGDVTFKSAATAGVSIPALRKVVVMWTGAAFEMSDPVADASDWAAKTSGAVDGTSFSAKEYAQGTQSSTGGSSKNWAQQSGAVTGASANDRSAKGWAQSVLTGATLGGSSKDWAQTTGGTVDGTEYSAKEHAAGSTVATGSAKNWATQLTTEVVAGQGYSARQYADNAATSASAASTSATNAATAETNAETAAADAGASEANAAASAVAAAVAASAVIGTSTTSLAIGTGSKVFTTQSGKQFFVGQRIRAASAANPTTRYMDGVVTAYSSTSLTVTIDVTSTLTGAYADWNLGPTGERGIQGETGDTGPVGGGALYAAKSGAYTVISTDNSYLLECTGTFTLTLTAAATLTSAFSFWVSNAGTGAITIDPASSELIDGAATLDVLPGQTRLVQCTGTAWETTKFSTGNWHQYGAAQVVGSPVASVVFSNIPTGATDLKLVWSGASHNNGSAAEISIDISDDNGSNYRTGLGSTGGFVAASLAHSGVMFLSSYRDGIVRNEGAYSSDAAATRTDGSNYGGARPNIKIAGVNAIRLLPSAGSIDAGAFTLFIRG